MPRRKKQTGLGVVDVPVGSSVALEISQALKNVPPAVYAMAAEEPHQRAAWFHYKQHFKRVGAEIDSHFRGTPPPDLTYMEEAEKELILHFASGYLLFYEMVRLNWTAVSSALKSASPPPISIAKGNGIEVPAPIREFSSLLSPLDVAIETIKYDAIAVIIDYFIPYKGFETPYRIREAIKREEDARKPKATPDQIQKHQDSLRRLLKDNPCSFLKMLCTQAVIDSKPKETRKEQLKNYQRHLAAGEAMAKAAMHPNKVAHMPRCEVRNGVLIEKCS